MSHLLDTKELTKCTKKNGKKASFNSENLNGEMFGRLQDAIHKAVLLRLGTIQKLGEADKISAIRELESKFTLVDFKTELSQYRGDDSPIPLAPRKVIVEITGAEKSKNTLGKSTYTYAYIDADILQDVLDMQSTASRPTAILKRIEFDKQKLNTFLQDNDINLPARPMTR